MLDALAIVADEMGPEGRSYLLGLLQERLKPSRLLSAEHDVSVA